MKIGQLFNRSSWRSRKEKKLAAANRRRDLIQKLEDEKPPLEVRKKGTSSSDTIAAEADALLGNAFSLAEAFLESIQAANLEGDITKKSHAVALAKKDAKQAVDAMGEALDAAKAVKSLAKAARLRRNGSEDSAKVLILM